MTIIALDPGKTTGVATWINGSLSASGEMSRQEALAYVESWSTAARVADTLYLHVVIERFLIGRATVGKEGDAHYALGAIGVIEYLSERDGFTHTIQGAAKAKNFCDNSKLRTLGWYHPTTGGHCNDALRHLVTYLVDSKLMDPRCLIPPS